ALTRLGVGHGIIASGAPETDDRVQVASVMTLVRRLHRLSPAPTLLVPDEAHHCAAPTWHKIFDALSEAHILGLNATPCRLDGKPLDDVFETLVVGPSIARLIDDGWLAPVIVFTPARNPDLTKVQIRAGDFATEQLATVMSGGLIIEDATAEYERLCRGAAA